MAKEVVMESWWANISQFEKVFWYCAVPASVLLLIQLVLSFIGLEHGDTDMSGGVDLDHDFSVDVHDGDVDVDFHAESSSGHHDIGVFKFFTVKSFIYFFCGFGWAGITAMRAGLGNFVAGFIAAVVGIVFSGIIFYVMYLLSKLSASGNTSITNAVGQIGTVYLPIKANKSESGVIQVSIQGSLREVQALTEDQNDLRTGEKVRVVSVVDADTVVVSHV